MVFQKYTFYYTIPQIIGKTKKEAKSLINSLYGNIKIEFVGDGDKVIDSSPRENSRVKQGSTIKIMLN